jgi:predicted nucleic acid-binding protein
MTRRLVNASPLIYLAKLGQLALLRLGTEEVLLPSAVLEEIRAKQDIATEQMEQHLGTWLKVCSITRPEVLRFLPDLGEGERDVIAEALQEGIASVVLDDQEARRLARRMGLEPVGTVGLLLAAKKRSLLPSVKDELERLRGFGFWVSEELVSRVLQEAGEVDS